MKVSKVRLRKGKNKKGDKYLWRLDIYPPIRDENTGKEIRLKSTGLYTWVNPRGEIEKHYNNETLAKLKAMASKVQLDVQNKSLDFLEEYNQNKDFLAYFLELAKKRQNQYSNYSKRMIVYDYLKDFSPQIKVKEFAVKAREFKKQFLQQGTIILKNIKRGEYFRIVAEVYVNGKSLSLQLIKNNLGVIYRGDKKFEEWCLLSD